MTPQHEEIDIFYWDRAGGDVDMLRARLGIPAPAQFRPKPAPIQVPAPLIERPWFIVGMYVVVGVVLAFTAWRKA